MARRRYQIDTRTQTMSATALQCRTFGHHVTMLPTPAKLRASHKRDGERLIQLRCTRDCGYSRDLVVDFWSGESLRERTWYAEGGKDYLVQGHGMGRLPKSAARAAFFAHTDQS